MKREKREADTRFRVGPFVQTVIKSSGTLDSTWSLCGPSVCPLSHSSFEDDSKRS